MKTLFEILPESIDADNCMLVCEMTPEGFSYAIKNEEQNQYVGVAVFEYGKETDEKEYGNNVRDVIANQSLLHGNFKKVCVMYCYKESVLIPFTLYSSLENENVLNLVHGDIANNASILTDLVAEGGVYNVYRVPAQVHAALNATFPGAEFTHQYSILSKKNQPEGDKLFVTFYQNRILLKLNKSSQTRLLNSFCYNTAEDVSYILLNACKQFDVTHADVEIDGLIEKDSNLYKEIYKYFETINFAAAPQGENYSEKISEQPAHYFSHIFAIDSCE